MAVINVFAVDRKIEMEFFISLIKLDLLAERWLDFPSLINVLDQLRGGELLHIFTLG